jgi:hypothetical protein
MLARPACQNISTEPPPARPVLLSRPVPRRLRPRRGATFALWVRQSFARGAAGIVEGMLAGCLTGLVLGAACGFLYLCSFVLAGSSGISWSEMIGLLCLSGIFLFFIAVLTGAALGHLTGLFVGGVVGAVSALLRGGAAGRIAGLVLGAVLSPLLLVGSPWANPITQVLMAVPGAIGGFRVAAVVGEETRRLP